MKQNYDHIVLISLDTLRGDAFGFDRYKYLPKNIDPGYKRKSILLDEFASRGIHFTNCFTAAPFTTASHASIFTGFLPLHHGCFEYFNSDIKKKTIFEYVKEDGHKTIFQTDFPMILGEPIGFTRGIDHYHIEDEYGALEALAANIHAKTTSLFHFGGIHYPYGFHTLKYGGDDYRLKVEQLENDLKIDTTHPPRDQFDETRRKGEDKELLFRYKRIVEYLYKEKEFKKLMELYFEGVDYFLENRFRNFLNQLLSVLENSNHLIILFGDHGEEWSDDSKGHYKSLTTGILNVPLIITGSNIRPHVVDYNVQTIDIAPTILDLLGLRTNEVMDGIVLDLFRPTKIKSEGRESVAQVWLGVGKEELISHIENAHKNHGFIKTMKTLKRGESIIQDDSHLVRKFDKNGDLESEILTSLSGKPVSGNAKDSLLVKLEEYNKTALPVKRENLVDESVREQLKLLGYNV